MIPEVLPLAKLQDINDSLPVHATGWSPRSMQPEVGAVVIEEQDVQDDAATDTNGNGTPKARRKQVPKAPTFLSSLDLTTAPVSLQDFATAKNPTALNYKYLVVATWFKEQMKNSVRKYGF